MPIYTYSPQWEALPAWLKKFKTLLAGYTGLVGIRLHRTGFPLTVELFGRAMPEKELYPLLTFQVVKGAPVESWARLEDEFDIPWVSEADFHRYRLNPMEFYHADDIIEPIAEEIANTPDPAPDLLARAFVDHAALAAKA